jgi:hypothetical protein
MHIIVIHGSGTRRKVQSKPMRGLAGVRLAVASRQFTTR